MIIELISKSQSLMAETVVFGWLTLWIGGMMLVATVLIALLV